MPYNTSVGNEPVLGTSSSGSTSPGIGVTIGKSIIIGVGVGTNVLTGIGVGVDETIGILVGVGTDVLSGIGVGVDETVGILVGVGTGVLTGIGVGVDETIGILVGVGTDVLSGIGVGVDASVGILVGVGTDVLSGIGVGVGINTTAQKPLVIILLSSVTAPVRANNCPFINAPLFAVIEAIAKICPTKVELAPNVAELPTFQKVRQKRALFVKVMLLATAVISVDAVLNTKTPSGSPCASSVRIPVI